MNQESHLLTNSDHFPTKSINIFGNSLNSNPDQDHDETTNSIPQPMSLIKQENAEQVNIKYYLVKLSLALFFMCCIVMESLRDLVDITDN